MNLIKLVADCRLRRPPQALSDLLKAFRLSSAKMSADSSPLIWEAAWLGLAHIDDALESEAVNGRTWNKCQIE